jgi:hypothetical protein
VRLRDRHRAQGIRQGRGVGVCGCRCGDRGDGDGGAGARLELRECCFRSVGARVEGGVGAETAEALVS